MVNSKFSSVSPEKPAKFVFGTNPSVFVLERSRGTYLATRREKTEQIGKKGIFSWPFYSLFVLFSLFFPRFCLVFSAFYSVYGAGGHFWDRCETTTEVLSSDFHFLMEPSQWLLSRVLTEGVTK